MPQAKYCYCSLCGSGGATVDVATYRQHKNLEATAKDPLHILRREQEQNQIEELSRNIFRMTLTDQDDTLEEDDQATPSRPVPACQRPSQSQEPVPPHHAAAVTRASVMDILKLMDQSLIEHADPLIQHVEATVKAHDFDASKIPYVLEDIEEHEDEIIRMFTNTLSLKPTSQDESFVHECLVFKLKSLRARLRVCKKQVRSEMSGCVIPDEFDCDKFFEHELMTKKPHVILAAFIVLVLNILGHVPQRWCNVTLRLLKTLLQSLDRKSDKFPTDIRTVREKFDLEAQTTAYAACPNCSFVYAPTRSGNINVYPPICSNVMLGKKEPCGARLTKLVAHQGTSVRSPKRPYLVQDFNSFIGGLLSRHDIEDALDNGTRHALQSESLNDLSDASGFKDFLCPDNKPFIDGRSGELRLLWTVSIDWFNPYMNKAAGKSASVGCIIMVCLNLPPDIRYKQENLYLAGIIPGPREPTAEQIDYFLEPLVQMLHRSYQTGTFFSRTHRRPMGVVSRSAILPAVMDLVAARKVFGCASHSAIVFCNLCKTTKGSINNIDYDTWTPRTYSEHLEAATEWKAAESKSARRTLFKKTGVRWSAWLQLPYWDPTKQIVIDGMHNLFLGVVKFHFEHIIGLDQGEKPRDRQLPDRSTVSTTELRKARRYLDSDSKATIGQWRRIRMATLYALCEERRVVLPAAPRGVHKKMEIVGALMERTFSASTESVGDSAGTDNSDVPNLIGDEFFCEEKSPNTQTASAAATSTYVLSKEELKRLHDAIMEIVRPVWHSQPPRNLGEPSHGKLKADLWRVLIEFDMPAFLVRMWSRSTSHDESVNTRRRKLLHSTMLLSAAVEWATSRTTSSYHAQQYTKNMHEYLASIRGLYPDLKLRPNHHMALHIGPFLERFGPMRSWWMFPYERVIGLLQQTNTNHRFGELESTMLKTFCAAANIKAFLKRGICAPIIQDCRIILEHLWDTNRRGTLEFDIRRDEESSQQGNNRKPMSALDFDIYNHLCSLTATLATIIDDWTTPLNAVHLLDRTEIRGMEFSTFRKTQRNSVVFYKPLGEETLVPGQIRDIFILEQRNTQDIVVKHIFVAVHRYAPLVGDITSNPFLQFPQFGAILASNQPSAKVDIIPTTQEMYHAIWMKWDSNLNVLKGLSRVK